MTRLRCRLGLHDWDLWVSGTRTNEELVTDYRAQLGVRGRFHPVTVYIQARICKGCGREQHRRIA